MRPCEGIVQLFRTTSSVYKKVYPAHRAYRKLNNTAQMFILHTIIVLLEIITMTLCVNFFKNFNNLCVVHIHDRDQPILCSFYTLKPDSGRNPKTVLQLYNVTWVHHELCCQLIPHPKTQTRDKLYGTYFRDLLVHAPNGMFTLNKCRKHKTTVQPNKI